MTGRDGGALAGMRVVEFAALGPLEHAGMLLADLGAEVLRVERPDARSRRNVLLRGRITTTLDLKSSEGRTAAFELLRDADVLLEGMRPGVMERLGLGPAEVAAVNPRIVYGRMTGWGQTGPLAAKAGHDINYVAETGALWATRTAGARPTPALNLVGDNGGGSLYLVMGVLAGLLERERSGVGTVIDAAIVDGTASLLQTLRGWESEGQWVDAPHANLVDTGRPWYDTYECADGEYMAVGAMEPQFYAALLEGLGLVDVPERDDPANWPALRERFTAAFRARTQAAWIEAFAELDACVTPVRSPAASTRSPHLRARGTWLATEAGWSAAPAPRFTSLPDPGKDPA